MRFICKIHAKVCMLIVVFTCLMPGFLLNLMAQDADNYHLKTVVIDAGHGGKDPGAPGRIKDEKAIVLSIALKVGHYIETHFPDIKVIYTRTTDTLIPLYKRAEIANKNKADLFISIHINANEDSKAHGTETYFMGQHKTQSNLEVAKKENSAIFYEEDYTQKYQGFDPNSSESYIIFSLMQQHYLEQSINFASYVQKNFQKNTNLKNRGVKSAGFLVLYKTAMPRVLIEAGFISNPNEEKYLNAESGQEQLAVSIYEAFKEYKKKIESSSVVLKQSEKRLKQDSILFKIQVVASSDPIPLKSDFFKDFDNVEEHRVSDQYKYTIGKTSNYEEAEELKQKIQQSFPGAFIVAFENNQPISLDKALSIKNSN